MASISISGAPQALDMNNFRSVSSRYGSLAKSCRFAVTITPTSTTNPLLGPYKEIFKDLVYLCEVAEYPGRGFESISYRYYGPEQRQPFQSKYEDINLTFLCRTRSAERQLFDDWMDVINPINSYDFNYKQDYVCQIDIFQYSDFAVSNNGIPKAEYMFSLKDAWPTLVNPQPVTWADDQFLRLGVTFTYTNWSRGGLDPAPSTDANSSWNAITTNISGY
jgi:hypothetical protein